MERASDSLKKLLGALGIHDQQGFIPFVAAWMEIAGHNLGAHSQPMDLNKGMLVIRIDHPGWLVKFRMEERRILRQIKERFPSLEIQKLVYRIGPLDQKSPGSALQSAKAQAPAEPTGEAPESLGDESVRASPKPLPDELQGRLEQFRKILRARENQHD